MQLVEQAGTAGEMWVAGRDVRHPHPARRGVPTVVGAAQWVSSPPADDQGNGRGGRCCPVQEWVMGQDRGLQILQVSAWVDPELVGENLPGPPVGIQRLRLPAAPV